MNHKQKSAVVSLLISIFLSLVWVASPTPSCLANDQIEKAKKLMTRTNTMGSIKAKFDPKLFALCEAVLTAEPGKNHSISFATLEETEQALAKLPVNQSQPLSYDTFVIGALEATRDLLKSCAAGDLQKIQAGEAVCRQSTPTAPGNSRPLSAQVSGILRRSENRAPITGYTEFAEKIPGVGGGVPSGGQSKSLFSPGDPTSDPYLPFSATSTYPGAPLKKGEKGDYTYTPPAIIGDRQLFGDLIFDIPVGKGQDERLEAAAKSSGLPDYFKTTKRENRIFLAAGGMNHVHMLYDATSTTSLNDLRKEFQGQVRQFTQLDKTQPPGTVVINGGSKEEDVYKCYFGKAPPDDMAVEEMIPAIDFHRRKVKGKYVAKLRILSGAENNEEVLAQFRRDLVIQDLLTELARSFHPKNEDPRPLIEVVPILYNQQTLAQGVTYQKAVNGTKVSDLYELVSKAESSDQTAIAKLEEIGFLAKEAPEDEHKPAEERLRLAKGRLQKAENSLRLLEAFYREVHHDILRYTEAKGVTGVRNAIKGADGTWSYATVGGDYNHGQNVIWDKGYKIIDF